MHLRDLHYIRRSDRRVIWFLLAIFVIVSAVLWFFHDKEPMTSTMSAVDSTGMGRRSGNYYSNGYPHGRTNRYYAVPGRTVSRFPFDPNTADSTELLALGLAPWQVRSIYRYRAKGGVFRSREDFGRIYGLTRKQYRDLAPYVRIGADYQPYDYANNHTPYTTTYRQTFDSAATHHYPTKLRQGEHIELNAADTTQLMKVPGIGRYYAKEIAFRRRYLGGFYSAQQLLEIADFPKETLAYFEVDPTKVHRLNVNKLSLNELKRHPYINYYQARDIVDYRRLRGPIHDIEELKLAKDFTNADFERLKHYIEY